MQRVWSDILMAAAVGLSDSVLDCVRPFLTDRTQQIAYSGQLSAVQSVLFGVPQRSVLGMRPLLYQFPSLHS